MVDKQMGNAGIRIVVEDALQGEEISILALCDGTQAHILPFAQDHKRAFDGDTGPNTGGMGVVAPIKRSVLSDMITPALQGLADEGTPFRGVLFAGVMLTDSGPFVLEYNCRWGDPETQAILPLMDNDLYTVLCGEEAPRWSESRYTAAVVMASHGYPGNYQTGLAITGLDNVPSDVYVFHAGTKRQGDQIITAGGRVLAVTGTGDSLQAAIDRAYSGVRTIHFDGAQFRTDIGAKVLAHEERA
jgi:phosphoribosylamine--glycine ligase